MVIDKKKLTAEKNGANYFALRLKMARKLSGLSQTELAQKLNSFQNQVARWEAGKSDPSVENIKRISEITNQPVSFFFEEGSLKLIAINNEEYYRELYELRKEMDFLKEKLSSFKKNK